MYVWVYSKYYFVSFFFLLASIICQGIEKCDSEEHFIARISIKYSSLPRIKMAINYTVNYIKKVLFANLHSLIFSFLFFWRKLREGKCKTRSDCRSTFIGWGCMGRELLSFLGGEGQVAK